MVEVLFELIDSGNVVCLVNGLPSKMMWTWIDNENVFLFDSRENAKAWAEYNKKSYAFSEE
jgi:hypothetical protein